MTLRAIHRFILKNGSLSAVLALAAVCVCALLASQSKFNESIADILPVHDRLIEEQEEALRRFGQDRTLYFSLSADTPDTLPALSEKFAASLRGVGGLEDEFHGGGSFDLAAMLDAAVAFAPFIFNAEDIGELRREISQEAIDARFRHLKNEIVKYGPQPYSEILTRDPFGIMSVMRKKFSWLPFLGGQGGQPGAIISPDARSSLIMASFSFDSKDSAKSSELVEKISNMAAAFEEENPGAKVAYAGAYRISADNASMARSDSNFCLSVSMAMMLLLCVLAFTRRVYALFAMLPSLLGTLFAFAAIGLLFRSVSAISIGFASIAIGVTIDYAIHFLFHANAGADKTPEDFTRSAEELARPTLIGAATTIIAFAIMFFAGSRGFSQLGAFGAMGVAASAFLSLAVLPPLAAKLKYKKPSPSVFDAFAAMLHRRQNPAIFYGAAAMLSAISAVFVFSLEFDGRISSFSGLYEATKADDAAIRAAWPNAVSKSLAVVRGKDLDEALELNAALFKKLSEDPDAENPASVSAFIPSASERAKNLAEWNALFKDRDAVKERVRLAAQKHGFKAGAFDAAIASLEPQSFEAALRKLDGTMLAPLLKSKIRGDESGTYISTLFNIRDGADRAAVRERIGAADSPDIMLADNILFENHVSSLALEWMLKFLAIALALVSAYVLFAFRSAFKAFIVILPVAVGLFWTFGAMALFGIPVTLINAIFVIFAVCIAEDYSVFIIFERLRGGNSGAVQSVTVSALTTIVGFGALGLARHPVLSGLGLTAAISIFCILSASLLIALPMSKKLEAKNG